MPKLRTLKQSFVGGELSPDMDGRLDLDKFQSGLALCKNFLVLPQGPVANRGGLHFVREIKNSPFTARLIPFSFSNSQTFCIELGAGYFRFHTQGATLLSAGVPYEIANPYLQAELFDIHYVQSGDIITLVHPNHPPKELRRISNLNWTLTSITFASSKTPPATVNCAATYTTAGTPETYQYLVTTLDSYGREESAPSAHTAAVTNDLTITGNYNTVTWSAVSGAGYYNIYKSTNGAFGYVGQVVGTSFVDRNVLADMTITPPMQDTVFTSANNYPSAVGYYEQRRFFAGTNNQPQNIWGTQSGTESNMYYSVPSQAADALRLRIAAQRANYIRHIVTMLDMLMMTASTEFRVFSQNGSALEPSTVTIKAQSQNGASNVQPVVVNNTAIFASSQGGHLREIAYQWQLNGYQSNDLCLMASHLFNNYTIVDLAFSRSPYPTCWAVNNQGKLLGLTYLPEQQLTAWHQHTTDGYFESVCAVTESNFDVVYAIVRRTIGGVTKRYVEMLDTRSWTVLEDAFFVDSGLSYSGAPTATLTGLNHLEGKTVSILGDGAVMPQQVVSGGSITLPNAVSKAHVGLPIEAAIKSLPASFQDETSGQSRVKNINQVWVKVASSGQFSAGPDAARQTPIRIRSFEPFGTPPSLKTEEIPLVIQSDWNQTGQVEIQQNDPLPLEIVYLAMEVAVGG